MIVEFWGIVYYGHMGLIQVTTQASTLDSTRTRGVGFRDDNWSHPLMYI